MTAGADGWLGNKRKKVRLWEYFSQMCFRGGNLCDHIPLASFTNPDG